MEKRCFIAGAGEYTGLVFPGVGYYIIAADGGYEQLVSRNIAPDLVVGDFDSLDWTPDHPHMIHVRAEKDDTDMMLAVREGLARGHHTFIIDGGMEGRLDHTIANLQILVYLAGKGARGVLLGRGMCATAVVNGSIRFEPGRIDSAAARRGGISVFCAGETAVGVTLTGLKYPLNDATITGAYPIGVSNEFTGAPAVISVRKGALLVTWSGGPELLDKNEE